MQIWRNLTIFRSNNIPGVKVLIVCMLIVGVIFLVFKNRNISIPEKSLLTSHLPSVVSNDTVSFTLQIQPILVNHCSPCHFTGGKMYEKMPFDKGETIIKHEAGLLRRIKDEKEKAIIQKFISEQKIKIEPGTPAISD